MLADVATPENERELCDQAKECSVRELAEVARSRAELAQSRGSPSPLVDTRVASCASTTPYRTLGAQLPPDSYAQIKAAIDAQVKADPL